jgi:hypothetical protein
MATTTVSIGSNQSIDTETPATSSGSGPSYVVTFGTTPSGIHVGDIGTMDTFNWTQEDSSDYTFLVTAISGANITLKYCTDGNDFGDASPLGLYSSAGSSGSPVQQVMVFKRAFSTITLFEAMIDDSSPTLFGTSDDVVGELHSDSAFTDATVNFDQKQSLSSVTLSVYSGDRHDGTAESGALWKPTANSGHNQGILRINIDNMIAEWLDISLDSLDSRDTNKAIVLVGTNDDNIIRNNLIHDKGGNPGNTGPFIIHLIGAGASSDTLTIQNNIIYNVVETSNDNAAAMLLDQWAGTVNIYNNTIYNIESQGGSKVAIGIRSSNPSGSTSNVKNNIVAKLVSAASNGERAFEDGPANGSSGTFNEAYNLSDDTSATIYDARGTGSLANKTLAEIDFVSTSAGSEDLHLDTSSVCLEAGVDLGTTNGVNIDIDGVDRDATGVTWDIGADQKSTASATGSPAFMLFMD